jgi:hypothetical protein
MPVMIEGHGGHPVSGFSRFARIYAQFLKGMGELAGAFVPLTPGKPEILAGVTPVDNADIIRVHLHRSFHESRQKQRIP